MSTFEKRYTVGDNEHYFRTKLGETKSWDEADAYCKGIEGSYILAVVNDRSVQIALARFMELADLISNYAWTGITQTRQNQWFWVDQTPYKGKLSALSFTVM